MSGPTVATVVPDGCNGWKIGASIVIDTEEKPVAEQMWHSVQNVMTYAKSLIEPLLKTLGMLEAEMSSFCWRFESLVHLKDEYVK